MKAAKGEMLIIEVPDLTIDFTISGENMSLVTLKQYSRDVENDLRAMEGISQIQISGYPDQEIEIAVREIEKDKYQIISGERRFRASKLSSMLTEYP